MENPALIDDRKHSGSFVITQSVETVIRKSIDESSDSLFGKLKKMTHLNSIKIFKKCPIEKLFSIDKAKNSCGSNDNLLTQLWSSMNPMTDWPESNRLGKVFCVLKVGVFTVSIQNNDLILCNRLPWF